MDKTNARMDKTSIIVFDSNPGSSVTYTRIFNDVIKNKGFFFHVFMLPEVIFMRLGMSFLDNFFPINQTSNKYRETGISIIREESELAGLQCMDGKFYPKILYVEHPHRPNYYIIFSKFHRYLLDQKKAEFVRLACALGAKDIKILNSSKNNSTEKLKTKLNVVEGADLSASAEVAITQEEIDNLRANFKTAPEMDPSIPEGMIWMTTEELWKVMAEIRLSRWVDEYEIEFSHTSDYRINAELAGKMTGIGLDLGGNFQDFKSISQKCFVSFFARSEYPSKNK